MAAMEISLAFGFVLASVLYVRATRAA